MILIDAEGEVGHAMRMPHGVHIAILYAGGSSAVANEAASEWGQ
jgi:hypothetical protein